MGRILVVDDEPGVLHAFREMLAGLGHQVLSAANGAEGVERMRDGQPDVVVTDLSMPGMSGMEMFREVRAIDAKLPVIIMTGHGTMATAIEATKLGAFDYQLKPFEPELMVAAIERALEGVRLMQRSVELNPAAPASTADAIIGDGPEMQEVYKAIGRVAATEATVLIRGESGTGKELVARAIYQHSQRSAAPMLVVNCVAIPEALLESELFGHERGAFTGAAAQRIGKFEQARGGTVFLDEIGDIPLSVQGKILRVLQQRTFDRVGGSETITADVRVLTATNRNLEGAIADGTFREDLYHRLNVVTIYVPPLRERRGDIPKLVHYFLDRYALELKIDKPVVSDGALDALCSADWPGNVRELEHCIYRTLIFTRGYPIQAVDVLRAHEVAGGAAQAAAQNEGENALLAVVCRYLNRHGGDRTHERLLADAERLLIVEALRRSQGNQTHAAQLMGITRPTLHAKIQRHGITYDS
jgi:nitrogen regulation protein NR(I)